MVHHRDTNVKHADVTRRWGWSFIVVDLGIGSVLGMRLSSVPLGWRGLRQHWRSPTATGPRRAESHMAFPDVAARPRAAAASLPYDRRQTSESAVALPSWGPALSVVGLPRQTPPASYAALLSA